MRSWTDVENNIVSVERVNEYADTPKEVGAKHGKHCSKEAFSCSLLTLSHCPTQASWNTEGSALPLAWPQSGTIEFQDYGLQYRKGLELALKGITLQIQKREKVTHLVKCESCHSQSETLKLLVISKLKLSFVDWNCWQNWSWEVFTCFGNLQNPRGSKGKDLHRWSQHC